MNKVLWNSNDAARATGGRNTKDWSAYGVSIDTRSLQPGDIFIALTANRDGHQFVAEAFRRGASAALVSYIPSDVEEGKPLLIVKNVKSALEALAIFGRRRCKAKVIAVTGSVGKTSTKEMLALVLSSFGKVSKAEKSYNNHVGVPLTLARTPLDSDFLIVEIGMSNKGEIAPLSALAQPDICLITDVSEAHLASFKNVTEIAKEKSDICVGLSKNNYCIVSRDSAKFSNLSEYLHRFGVRIISFGEHRSSNYKLTKIVIKNNKTCAKVVLESGPEFYFKVNCPGNHHAKNALGVICILDALKMDVTKGIFTLSSWSPMSGRGLALNIKCSKNYLVKSFTIIDETYNANPTSMKAAMLTLANFSNPESKYEESNLRRIAILGDMLELGRNSKKKHSKLALELDLNDIDLVHCIGDCMHFFYKNLPEGKKGKWSETVKEFSLNITDLIKNEDIIMLKASNSVGLNYLLKKLMAMDESWLKGN